MVEDAPKNAPNPRAKKPHAEIEWRPWLPEVFREAERENKLVLLDSGATWCHWCHVMDRVTYEDPQVAKLLNEQFLPVRIDRDRLPDVDARYQRLPAILQSPAQGGWPLTVVLTPSGVPVFKATFLPPRRSSQYGGGPGLIDILTEIRRLWEENREKLLEAEQEYNEQMDAQMRQLFAQPGQVGREQVRAAWDGIAGRFDARHGGFGGAPKFFSPPTLELGLLEACRDDERARKIVSQTLHAMSDGGVHDQLAGGFHRYSVDERWHVPHFEKMAYDNAALLKLYARASRAMDFPRFAEVARDTAGWILRDLSSEADRGFFASQDADVGLSDDGDYFTWTVDEVRDALGDEADAFIEACGLTAEGDMPHRPGRNVLYIARAEAAEHMGEARRKLLEARRQRERPGIDHSVFADLNGMLIDALLCASALLGEPDWARRAMANLDALLEDLRTGEGAFAHFRDGGGLRSVGLLGDQAWMARALLTARQYTGRSDYLEAAERAGEYILEHLLDDDGAPLSKPKSQSGDPAEVPAMRSWEDMACRSSASVAAEVLLDLGYLTGRKEFDEAGRRALGSAAGALQGDSGMFLAGYAIAADRLLNGPTSVLVLTEDGDAEDLLRAARQHFLPHKILLSLDTKNADDRAMLERLGYAPPEELPTALLCVGRTCLRPARSPQELRDRIAECVQL